MDAAAAYLHELPLTESEWEEQYYRNQHQILPFSAVSQGAIPKPPPLVEGVLLDRTITMISAEPYCGKTMFALSLAIAIASSLPFLDTFSIPLAKPVLFLGQDAPSWDYAEQARKLARGYGRGLESIPLDMALNSGLSIVEPGFAKLLNDWHEATDFGVLIIDTLASFHHFDENESRSMGLLMTALKRIRDRLGCAVIFTHHTSKPMGDTPRSLNYAARGSTVISGSVDFHYAMHRPKRMNEEERIDVHFPKGRGNESWSELTHFIIEDVDHADGPAVKLHPPASFDGPKGVILDGIRRGMGSRVDLAGHLLGNTKGPLREAKALKIVDNNLQVLRRLGKIHKDDERGWVAA